MNAVRWMIVVVGLLLGTVTAMGQEKNPPMPPDAVIVNNSPGVLLGPIAAGEGDVQPNTVTGSYGWGDASIGYQGFGIWGNATTGLNSVVTGMWTVCAKVNRVTIAGNPQTAPGNWTCGSLTRNQSISTSWYAGNAFYGNQIDVLTDHRTEQHPDKFWQVPDMDWIMSFGS